MSPKYVIKATSYYEITCNNDEEAIESYETGLWDYDGLIEENAFELGRYTTDSMNREYKVIKSS